MTRTATTTSTANGEIPGPGALAVLSPSAAATAAPAQSLARSLGSMALRRMSLEAESLMMSVGTRNA